MSGIRNSEVPVDSAGQGLNKLSDKFVGLKHLEGMTPGTKKLLIFTSLVLSAFALSGSEMNVISDGENSCPAGTQRALVYWNEGTETTCTVDGKPLHDKEETLELIWGPDWREILGVAEGALPPLE